jgi:type I restriction enzyme R subunit
MSDIAETAVQAALVERLTKPDLGWTSLPGAALDRPFDSVLIESDVIAALARLNPAIAEKPERVDEVLPRLRAAIISVRDDGLVEANRRLVGWLRGHETVRFTGTDDFVAVRLVDFNDPRSNRLVVSTEVTYRPGTEERRMTSCCGSTAFPSSSAKRRPQSAP